MRNAEELRGAIDRGETGDKMPASDPAAAPLGTDEEAAGTPVPASSVQAAAAHETSGPSHPTQNPTSGGGLGSAWIIVAAALLIAIAVIATAFYSA